jgi:ketosteroid isomerase-like protein
MMKKYIRLFVLIVLFTACREETKEVIIEKKIPGAETTNIDEAGALADRFYHALTQRDSAAVVSLLTDKARLYGTDPGEDWGIDEIRNYLSEKQRDTSTRAVFKVLTREVRMFDNMAYVIDKVDVSTTRVPFRIINILKRENDSLKVDIAIFSALVRNEDMKDLEALGLRKR